MRCPILGCKKEINGFTGFIELQNLVKHFKRKHKKTLAMTEALEIRLIAEGMEENDQT